MHQMVNNDDFGELSQNLRRGTTGNLPVVPTPNASNQNNNSPSLPSLTAYPLTVPPMPAMSVVAPPVVGPPFPTPYSPKSIPGQLPLVSPDQSPAQSDDGSELPLHGPAESNGSSNLPVDEPTSPTAVKSPPNGPKKRGRPPKLKSQSLAAERAKRQQGPPPGAEQGWGTRLINLNIDLSNILLAGLRLLRLKRLLTEIASRQLAKRQRTSRKPSGVRRKLTPAATRKSTRSRGRRPQVTSTLESSLDEKSPLEDDNENEWEPSQPKKSALTSLVPVAPAHPYTYLPPGALPSFMGMLPPQQPIVMAPAVAPSMPESNLFLALYSILQVLKVNFCGELRIPPPPMMIPGVPSPNQLMEDELANFLLRGQVACSHYRTVISPSEFDQLLVLVVKNRLDGAALRWFVQRWPRDDPSYEELEQALELVWGSPKYRCRVQAPMQQQGDLGEYILRFELERGWWRLAPLLQVAQQFAYGLQEPLRGMVLERLRQNPNATMPEVYNWARFG